MPAIDLRKICAQDLIKLLCEGDNISLTLVDNQVCISSTATGGSSNGIKYHLKENDNITVQECFEYLLCGNFTIDSTAEFTIEDGGRLALLEGSICSDGIICNDGFIKNGYDL